MSSTSVSRNFIPIVVKILLFCYRERIARIKEEDRLEREAMERRLRRDLVTKTFPKTREDFDQLYAMVSMAVHLEVVFLIALL